jgi:hypothetical protein
MLEGHHYQNAYVTRNIAKAAAAVTPPGATGTVAPFEASVEVLTARGRRPHVVKLAFFWVGGLQYELIEPVAEGAPMFSPWLPEGDELRFHHSCARVSDWDDFRRRVDQQPCPVVLEGEGSGGLKFLFLDARDLLGHYLEYTWMPDQMWARFSGQ